MTTPPTATLVLASADFRDGETMPDRLIYDGMGCTGANTSPALEWSTVPAGTKSLVLTLHDPDAPTTVGFTHWMLYDLDPKIAKLDAGAGKNGHQPHGAAHGLNDFGEIGYDGPCPPPGDPPHRYHFTLYALDVPKLEGAGHALTFARLRFMLRGHVLAEGTLTGRYGRR
jgi:Raf kinase inhibitor-like YbhB/YbcL family protein